MEDNKTSPDKTTLNKTTSDSVEKKPLAKSNHCHKNDKTPIISKNISSSNENVNTTINQSNQDEKFFLAEKPIVTSDSNTTTTPEKAKSQKSRRKKWIDLTIKQRVKVILLSLLGLIVLSGGTVFAVLYSQTPPLDVNNFNYIENARIMDVNGNFYQDLQGSEMRQNITIDKIPAHVQNAFIAIEDQRFRLHHGIDSKRLGKAVLGVFFGGNLDGPGGSTITQQLIKLTHLNADKTITRKFKEIILSLKLEKVYNKDQILEAYLNKINLSHAWGVEAASSLYFGKSISEINVAQGAVLASIANSPSYYDPYVYEKDELGNDIMSREPDGRYAFSPNNLERSQLVVNKMLELGYIDQAQHDQAQAELAGNQIGLTYNEPDTHYSYFTDSVYEQVVNDLVSKYHYTESEASDMLLNGGLTIHSTVDTKIQSIMEAKAIDESLFPSQSGAAAAASEAKTTDTGTPINYTPEVGMTIIDNQSGYVSGIVGGREEKTNLSLNRATRPFQPGSSTKPLTAYGPGIDTGLVTLGTVYEDIPISYQSWIPQNSSGGFSGQRTTVREGITSSINTIAVQACMTSGLDSVANYASKLGLDIVKEGASNDMTPAALALGGYTHGQSTLAMASAYATFPNSGNYKKPIFYTKVVDASGKVLLENSTPGTQVFKPQTAFLMTDALTSVVNGGTTNINVSGQPVAGKTGTTDENRHAWFCGYTPYYSMAVWYGYDENVVETSQGTFTLNIGLYGGDKPGPAAMFESVMNDVHSDLDSASFATNPGGITTAAIDRVSGKLATELTAQDPRGNMTFNEMFIDGTAPLQKDDSHVLVSLDISTGYYPTPYCPANLVQNTVRLQKVSRNFPSGITPVNSDYTGAEASLMVPSESEVCPVHTTAAGVDISLLVNGGAVGGTLNMTPGHSITVTANGPNNGTTTVSVNGSSASVSQNGNQILIAAMASGITEITVNQKVSVNYQIGSQNKTYETTYSKKMSINVAN